MSENKVKGNSKPKLTQIPKSKLSNSITPKGTSTPKSPRKSLK